MKLFVIDTSAIMGGFVPGLSDAELATIEEVFEEARDLCSKLKLETAAVLGKIRVLKPSQESIRKTRETVSATGDRLSETDVKLLALSLDLKGEGAVLLTDDYAIQNSAALLGVPYREVSTPGIKEVFRWVLICPACGKVYPPPALRCRSCGSTLERKPERKLKDGTR